MLVTKAQQAMHAKVQMASRFQMMKIARISWQRYFPTERATVKLAKGMNTYRQ